MTNAELLDLLREAKGLLPRCGTFVYPCDCMVCKVKVGINAALAERQDSATDVVEWHAYGYARNELRSRINGADVTVRFLAPNMSDIDTQYSWNVSLWGGATTLDEAKAAAIAAAKGMR